MQRLYLLSRGCGFILSLFGVGNGIRFVSQAELLVSSSMVFTAPDSLEVGLLCEYYAGRCPLSEVILYTRRFGSRLYSRLHLIACHCTDRLLLILVAWLGSNPGPPEC